MAANFLAARSYIVYSFLWQAIDWLYPPRCVSCSRGGYRFCPDCFSAVRAIHQDRICPICGLPQPAAALCAECRLDQPAFTALRSWGLYEGTLREAIHGLKYHRDLGVSQDLAAPLSRLITDLNWQVELIVPVPLSRERAKGRGYNQSEALARWVSRMTGIPIQPAALARIRDTASQVGLSGSERRQNVQGAFQARAILVTGKNILVVDDVATTGATMQASAMALKSSGATRVYGITLARAGHVHEY